MPIATRQFNGQVLSRAVVGIVAGVIVGLTLVAAGVLKLVEGPGWSKQAADMGVSRPVAMTVPFVEIAIGVPLAAQLLRLHGEARRLLLGVVQLAEGLRGAGGAL